MLPELFADDVFHIETSRLWLRWPRAADGAALHRIASRKDVADRTATWPHPLDPQEVDRRILAMREANAVGTALTLAITRKKEPGRLIGIVGLHLADDASLRIGFLLDPQWHDRGLMTEAVTAIIDIVLALAPIQAVRGHALPDNEASRRVLDKAGFVLVGTEMCPAPARGGPQQCHAFELTRTRWRQLRAASAATTGPRRPSEACVA